MANRRYIDFPIASTVGDSDIILIWQSGANKQTTKATFLSGLPENLDELNDVAISGLTNGQILRYDSVTGKWENTDQGNLDLNDLNDVSIVSPSNGQVLVYNSSTSRWENSSGGYVPYTGAVTTVNLGAQTIQAGSFVKAGGTSAQFLKANGSVDSTAYGTGSVTSVALTMPSAFSVANSPVTTAGTLAVTGAGTVGQYIRGDGSLADFPESSGGGSSVSYYLNGSVAQGTIGGVAYKELNKVPILGAGTDFTINADGYIASFITDAGDPNLLEIPAGNWNFETYFSASSGGGSPTFYVELYKVNSGGTATLIASNSTFPELIAFGTNIISYFSTLAVPTTALALTDRLAIRYYVTHSGRTITLHTEDNHLCQIVTTFTTGLTALNGLTAQIQNFAVGTSGTDFAISSATATHTFNLPTASATNRGALSGTDWTTFNSKQNALTNPVTGTGTTNYLAKFTGATTIGNSNIQDSGSLVSVGVAANFSSTVTVSGDLVSNVGAGATYFIMTSAGAGDGLGVLYNASSVAKIQLYTNGVSYFNGGNVLIGTNTDSGSRLEVAGGGIFSLLLSGNITDATRKFAFIEGKHYTNSEEPIAMIGIDSQVSSSILYLGGGLTSGLNAVTGISFYTAANNTTVTGTEQMRIFSDGNVLIQSGGTFTNNGAKLQVSGTATVSGIVTGNANEAFRLDPSSGASYMNFRIGGTSYSLIGIAGTTSDIIAGSALGDLNIRAANSQKILFSTNNGGSAAMAIASSGNVGIGTASVSGTYEKLAVAGGISIKDNTNAKLEIGRYNTTGAQNSYIKLGANSNSLRFTNNTDTFDLMELTNSGTVFIGTTASTTYGTLVVVQNSISSPNFVRGLQIVHPNGTGATGGYISMSNIGQKLGGIQVGDDLVPGNLVLNPVGGNVLIGTTTDNGARLQVSGTSTFSSNVGLGSLSNYTKFNISTGNDNQMSIGTNSTGQTVGIFFADGPTTTSSNYKWEMGKDSSNDYFVYSYGIGNFAFNIKYATGAVNFSNLGTGSVTATSGTLSTVSDLNYKINDGFIDSAIEKVLSLKPRYFYWNEKSGLPMDVRQLGFYAQEVNQALGEEAANTPKNKNIPWGISDRSIIAMLTKAIQELKQEIDTLKN